MTTLKMTSATNPLQLSLRGSSTSTPVTSTDWILDVASSGSLTEKLKTLAATASKAGLSLVKVTKTTSGSTTTYSSSMTFSAIKSAYDGGKLVMAEDATGSPSKLLALLSLSDSTALFAGVDGGRNLVVVRVPSSGNVTHTTTQLALQSDMDDLNKTLATKAPLASPALTGKPTVENNPDAGTMEIASAKYAETVAENAASGKQDAIGATTALSLASVTATGTIDAGKLTVGGKEVATNDKVTELLGKITSVSFQVVKELPSAGVNGVIYLVAHEHSGAKNVATGAKEGYDEYIWLSDQKTFEKLGTTDIDLSGYASASSVSALQTKMATAFPLSMTVTGGGDLQSKPSDARTFTGTVADKFGNSLDVRTTATLQTKAYGASDYGTATTLASGKTDNPLSVQVSVDKLVYGANKVTMSDSTSGKSGSAVLYVLLPVRMWLSSSKRSSGQTAVLSATANATQYPKQVTGFSYRCVSADNATSDQYLEVAVPSSWTVTKVTVTDNFGGKTSHEVTKIGTVGDYAIYTTNDAVGASMENNTVTLSGTGSV